MFQFTASPPHTLCIHVCVPDCLHQVGSPIRISTGQWLFAPLRSFSQLVASFFGFWCQGIHPMLLLAWSVQSLVRGLESLVPGYLPWTTDYQPPTDLLVLIKCIVFYHQVSMIILRVTSIFLVPSVRLWVIGYGSWGFIPYHLLPITYHRP